MEPLLVSASSLISSLGCGIEATATALRDRRSGLAPCAFETAQLDTYIGQVADAELAPLREDLREFDCRNNRLAQRALRQDGFEQALAAARDRYGAARIGVFIGTSTSGILETELAYRRRDAAGALPPDFRYSHTHNTYSVGWFVQRYLGLCGPAVVVSSACSSSAKVFGNASRMIAAGVCDAAVVGGVDSLCLTTLYGFGSLDLLSSAPCRPFDVDRNGISIGEGAGFVLLEKVANVPAGPDAIWLRGVGESSDAYHMSTPHPEGLGARLAMERALRDADLQPDDIDYVNLHGTGTRTNDASEEKAAFDLFGASIACSSTKGASGHLLGACGTAEAIFCTIALRDGFLPGSANTRTLDPAVRVHYLLDNEARPPQRVMSNAFGFGGTNCSLVFSRAH